MMNFVRSGRTIRRGRGGVLRALFILGLAASNVLAAPASFVAAEPQHQPASEQFSGIPLQPTARAIVNFTELAARGPSTDAAGAQRRGRAIPFHRQPEGPPTGAPPSAPATEQAAPDAGGPLAPSPPPTTNFQALEDGAKVDGAQAGFFVTPPDTMGAVADQGDGDAQQ
jgi:hypothetical protein